MSRRVLLLLVLVILVVAGAAVALVVTARPDLDDRRDAVDARWVPLRSPLTTRYDGLGQLADALTAAGSGDRSYTVDLAAEIARWETLTGNREPDAAAEAASANRLEGLAARTRVNVARSARLNRDPGVTQGLAAFDAALVPNDAVEAYNRAVRRYQATRTDTLKQIPAGLLGYDARPVLVLSGVSQPTG